MVWEPMKQLRPIVLKTDELSELKGQFLTSLNHEIRTPLSGILGMTDLLLETSLSDEQKEYVGATRLCAENLLEILNVTLEYSALSANHLYLEEAEFSLRETLAGLVSEFAFKAESKDVRLRHNFDRSLPSAVVGDALRLRQLIWHLLGNAVKFTQRGEVEVSASASRREGGVQITVAVRDTGIGIRPDQVGSIFESFRQLETGLARNYAGLGLGLAVAQKLAILLGGSIAVESEVGRGSVFTVQIPLRLPVDFTGRQDPGEVRGRVLVVDDDVISRRIVSRVLARRALDVVCVNDGPAAIRAASASRYDLILMDLQMPGMDGFQTAHRLRELAGYRETPVLAVTANCSSDYRDRCVQHGMQGFLSKPVQSSELVQTVEKYLAAPAVL
jgi:CheY-like chemotaxis protein/anti-sigma regulatory factor (Ser/Thr protein kinase)